jgi:DNA-binding beta-propeller fold protein YncE
MQFFNKSNANSAQGTIEEPFWEKGSRKESIAQGTIEYLVIISVVVVLSLIVTGIVISQIDSVEEISSSSSDIKQKIGVNGISLSESIVSLDGNGLLVLKNLNSEIVTINRISVDGVDHNYEDIQLFSGVQMSFKLQSLNACDSSKKNYSIKIYFTTPDGLEKSADFQVIGIDCTETVSPIGAFVEEVIVVLLTPPKLTFTSPVAGSSYSNATWLSLFTCEEGFCASGSGTCQYSWFDAASDYFSYPYAISGDGTYLYIADTGNNRIVKRLASDLSYVASIGTSGSGNDQFNEPMGISASGNYIYVADPNNHRIVKRLASNLSYVTSIGTQGSGDDQFFRPRGIFSDGTYVYVADTGNNRIVKRDASDLRYISKIGSVGSGDNQFNDPYGIFSDGNHIYVGDTENNRIVKRLASDLSFVSKIGTSGSGNDQFSRLKQISGDGTYLYIADWDNYRIVKRLASDLSYVSKIGEAGTGKNNFYYPGGIFSSGDYLYVMEWYNNRLVKRLASNLGYVSKIGSNRVVTNISYSDIDCLNLGSDIPVPPSDGEWELYLKGSDELEVWDDALPVDFNYYTNGIYECGTISSSGTYALLNNIGSGGDCLIVNADDVTINGRGFTINGNITASNPGGAAYTNLIINNVASIQNVLAIGGDTGSAGGNVTINNVPNILQNVNTSGGLGSYNGGAGGGVNLDGSVVLGEIITNGGAGGNGSPGGVGGDIYIVDSNINTINTAGGQCTTCTGASSGAISITDSNVLIINSLGGAGDTGGSSGSINISGSTIGPISSISGAGISGSGGTCGAITISNSITGAITSTGGDSEVTANSSAIMTITNSTITSITSTGGNGLGDLETSGASSGLITITGDLTQTGAISSIGGSSNSGTGGNGGDISIVATCPTLGNIGAFTCTGGTGLISNGTDGTCPHTCS